MSGINFGFCYESDGLLVGFSLNEEKISDDLLFEKLRKFSPIKVFVESEVRYMKPMSRTEVISLESLTALTDLERLADGRKRLKGYSQEDLLQEAAAFSGTSYFSSENRTAMLYID